MHKLVVQHVWLSPDLLYIFGFDSPTCLCIVTVHKITNLISLGRKILPQFLISKSYKMHRRPVSKCPFSSSWFFVFLFVSWNEDSAWHSMLIGGGLGIKIDQAFVFSFLRFFRNVEGNEMGLKYWIGKHTNAKKYHNGKKSKLGSWFSAWGKSMSRIKEYRMRHL